MPFTNTSRVSNFDFGAPVAGSGFAESIAAEGQIVFSNAPANGNSIEIGDGTARVRFVFDSSAAKATGTVTFSGQPADGNTVTINDGIVTKVFEFDSNSSITSGRVSVTIAGSASATMDNLIAAINGVTGFKVAAVAGAGDSADLTYAEVGTAGNVAITKVGTNIAVTGMSGGVAAAASGIDTPVPILGSMANATLQLLAAINASILHVTASRPSSDTIDIVSNIPGRIGNVAITKVGANITVTGMADGYGPSTSPAVLVFRHDRGGKFDLKFENNFGVNPVDVSIETSVDGLFYRRLTASDNLTAVDGVRIPLRQSREFTIFLREGIDTYVRVVAVGGSRSILQVRNHSSSDLVLI